MKKVMAIFLALTLLLGLAACGTSSVETTTNENGTPQTADNSQSQSADARHWDTCVLKVFEEHADTLAELFN